jgi:hypothetical protein
MTIISKHIFCQCMKPWSICISKQNSYKLDVRDLINIYYLSPYLNEIHLNFDFVNKRILKEKFVCRFSDSKKIETNKKDKTDKKDNDENI